MQMNAPHTPRITEKKIIHHIIPYEVDQPKM